MSDVSAIARSAKAEAISGVSQRIQHIASLMRTTKALICPTGKSVRAPKISCLALDEKYFAFSEAQISCMNLPCPASIRGAYRDRHGRGKRDAMDAEGSQDER